METDTVPQTGVSNEVELEIKASSKVGGKPCYEIEVQSILNFHSAFGHKLLCDGPTFSLGSACAGSCAYCYVESIVQKHPEVHKLRAILEEKNLKFEDVVITRYAALDILREQLTVKKPPKIDLTKRLVVYTSPLVDPALNRPQAMQTLEACNIILELTNWDIRLLSKGNKLRLIAEGVRPEHRHRLIFGHSTGIIDDAVVRAVEQNTTPVSRRIEEHCWLQDKGFRTYGMICPILPMPESDIESYIERATEMIRVEDCEHVWCEVINVRGDSMERTCAALEAGGFHDQAELIREVSHKGSDRWEEYARRTFEACAKYIPADKLRFLQYPDKSTMDWWSERREQGAVLLGKAAEKAGVLATHKGQEG